MTFVTIFAVHSLFLLPSFSGGKRKEKKKKNQSRGKNLCLSARSRTIYLNILSMCNKAITILSNPGREITSNRS